MAVSNRKRTELKIWRSIVFLAFICWENRKEPTNRNDGRSYYSEEAEDRFYPGGIMKLNICTPCSGCTLDLVSIMPSWWSQKKKKLLCTPRTIMVEFAISALAVGKRTEPLVRVRYIYLRKNVELWGRVTR